MSVWRCRVCEGVNRGGRTCTTCGAEVPPGEVLRAAVRRRIPSPAEPPPAPAPVPPTPRRRELREYPPPERLRPLEPADLFESGSDFDIKPMPGGCLVSIVPRRSSRRW